jgi:hypothetical protein
LLVNRNLVLRELNVIEVKMIDEKIARVKALIQRREEIDAELAAIFNGAAPAKRGRPRKEPGDNVSTSNSATTGQSRTLSQREGESVSGAQAPSDGQK